MIEPKDGEWWMVEHDSGDKRVMRYWLRDGDSDAVWNAFEDESDSFITAHSTIKPLYKMVNASGMESLESDYERGMREAMKDIAKSCGKTFSVDIGYLELPRLVDELVNKDKPKPRTNVMYEHLTQADTSVWDLREMLESGELFSKRSDNTYDLYSSNAECYMIRHFIEYGVYRKVEKEIDWREEVKRYFGRDDLSDYSLGYVIHRERVDAVSKGFIGMCHLVASLTDKPE